MTSKFSIDNKELLQRISSGEAVVGIDFGNLIVRELAAFRLAAMDSEPVIIVGDDGGDALAYRRLIQSFAPGTKLYRHAQPAPDYFASLVAAARVRADKAIRKFPQPNYVLNKVAEESGEVIKAVIHYTEGREEWSNVEAEIIDNLAMLIRLVKEGDQVIGFTPPVSCRAATLNGGKP